MATITINVSDELSRALRAAAALEFGKGKGHLQKAFSEAISQWLSRKGGKASVREAIALMQEGRDCGGFTYSKRGELHERIG
jgi:hypothetical protein